MPRLPFSAWRWTAIALAVGVVLAIPLLSPPPRASAHPLGNFTVNHYSRIELGTSEVRVHFVLDLAEIPAFQERDAIDLDGDGVIAAVEQETYLSKLGRDVLDEIELAVDGAAVDLTQTSSALSFPRGQGGLDTQRVELDFSGPIQSGGEHELSYSDGTYEDRLGWREIVVATAGGVRIADSTAPEQSIGDELRAYPAGALASPPNVTTAKASFVTSAGAPPSAPMEGEVDESARAVEGNPDTPLGRYAALIDRDQLTPGVIVLSLLAAVGFGAIHALSPGHGKTIVAAYLVGSRGTWRHVLLLALTVTVTHTSSVYVLGFVTLYLSQYVLPEELYPWLGIASGALIVAMGIGLVASRLRSSGLASAVPSWARLRSRLTIGSEAGAITLSPSSQETGAHDTTHGHEHAHGSWHSHTHAVPGQNGEPVSMRGLVGLGIFGGLLPCPSAIVVMLSAIALHRVGFGLLLIVAFSAGLAGVLTAIGFALVFAGNLTSRLPFLRELGSRLDAQGGIVTLAVRAFPVGSAAAVFLAGVVVLLRALAQQGAI